mmetsp:Transcript_35753/g.73088  ORF Transcript_35753/g.73088 Transcript_35753/m.73088 type:complete len:781 (-) Transcript_35753:45-2387(-)
MVSIRNVVPAAALIVSSILFASALSTPPVVLRRTNRIHIACSVVPKAMESTISMSKRKKNRKKRNQQLRKEQQQSSSASSSYYKSHYNFSNEREDVDEWLIRSTALILGEDETQQEEECSIKSGLPSQCASMQEYLYHARSVMKAWTHWNSRNTLGYRRDARLTVEVIFKRVLYVITHEETTTADAAEISELRPMLVSLVNIIIDAWANGNDVNEEAVAHTEGWLHFLQTGEMMDEIEEEKSLVVIGPDEESYRGVVKAYIRTQKRIYLEKALTLLEEMSSSSNHPNTIYPSTLTYNLVLYGLANAQPSSKKNAEIAENLLQKKMISSSQEENCAPDSNSFRQVISAWTKTGSRYAIEKTDEILNQILNDFPNIDPDASTFNAIMTLNLRLGRVEDAISVFNKMVGMHESGRIGTQPDIYSVNLLLKAMTRQRQHNQRQNLNEADDLVKTMEDTYHVHPDVQSFNIVIDAWSKSKLPEAVSRAERLLDVMERRCRNDSLAAKPDSYTFTSVLDSIARSEHSFHRAEKVFHRIEKLFQDGIVERPTIPVYNAYLNALVSSKDVDVLDRVESIFANMITERNANIRSYNTMLKAYSQFRSGRNGYFSRPLKAEELLTQMEEHSGIPYPDGYSYTTVINCFARSIVDRKAKKARQILDKMIQSYAAGNAAAKPQIYAFNGVLSASAHTHHTRFPEERLEAFTILVSTFLLLREWTEPNDSTYILFFQACERLLPKGHRLYEQVIETVVYSCVRDGQMSAKVMHALHNIAPDLAQQFEKIDAKE